MLPLILLVFLAAEASNAQCVRSFIVSPPSGFEEREHAVATCLRSLLRASRESPAAIAKKRQSSGGGDEPPPPPPPSPPPTPPVNASVQATIERIVEEVTSTTFGEESAAVYSTRVQVIQGLLRSHAASLTPAQTSTLISWLGDKAAAAFATFGVDNHTTIFVVNTVGYLAAIANDRAAATAGSTAPSLSARHGYALRRALNATAQQTLRGMRQEEFARAYVSEDAARSVELHVVRANAQGFALSNGLPAQLSDAARRVTASLNNASITAAYGYTSAAKNKELGFHLLVVRRNLYEASDTAVRSLHVSARIASVTVYDSNMNPFQVRGLRWALALRFDVDAAVRDQIDFERMSARCVYWHDEGIAPGSLAAPEARGAWRSDGCVTTTFTRELIECNCSHTTDFSAYIDVAGAPALPPGDDASSGDAPLIEVDTFQTSAWFWWLLLAVLFIWLALCLTGLFVLWNRRRRVVDHDTLQPYLDRAAGVGLIGAMAADVGDVTSSSERERRDFDFPRDGRVYLVPDASMSDDTRLYGDVSWGLQGADSVSRSYSELGDGTASYSELGDGSYSYSAYASELGVHGAASPSASYSYSAYSSELGTGGGGSSSSGAARRGKKRAIRRY